MASSSSFPTKTVEHDRPEAELPLEAMFYKNIDNVFKGMIHQHSKTPIMSSAPELSLYSKNILCKIQEIQKIPDEFDWFYFGRCLYVFSYNFSKNIEKTLYSYAPFGVQETVAGGHQQFKIIVAEKFLQENHPNDLDCAPERIVWVIDRSQKITLDTPEKDIIIKTMDEKIFYGTKNQYLCIV